MWEEIEPFFRALYPSIKVEIIILKETHIVSE